MPSYSMKLRSLILVGLLSAIVFAIALFPAGLAWKMASGSLAGLPVTVERVGGTVWNGFMVGRLNNPVLRGPIVVDWRLKGLRILMGEIAVGLRVEGNAYRLEGGGHWGLWGKGLSDVDGDLQAQLLDQSLRQFGFSAGGVLTLRDVSANLSGQRITKGEGEISWSGGEINAPGSGANGPIIYPPVLGNLEETEGALLISVKETESNLPLGELSLMPEKNLGSVKVLQRVISLAGMGDGGDDDKVMLNMQQPLPF